MSRHIKIILVIGSLFVFSIGVSQNEKGEFDTQKIEKWKSLEKYDYDKDFPTEKKSTSRSFSIPSFFGVLGRLAVYVVIIGIVGLIVYLIFRSIQQGRVRGIKLREDNDLHYTVEDELGESLDLDFDRQLQEALSQQNYRLAIRLHYLKALKALDEKNLIQWEKEKTNHDYFLELATGPYGTRFSSVLYIFNNIWYGYQTVDNEARYQELAQPIIHFQKAIR